VFRDAVRPALYLHCPGFACGAGAGGTFSSPLASSTVARAALGSGNKELLEPPPPFSSTTASIRYDLDQLVTLAQRYCCRSHSKA
jgi:hypothetical protein